MINNIFVEMLAYKIAYEEVNPITNKPFTIEDVKKEEYKAPISERVIILKKEREDLKNETTTN